MGPLLPAAIAIASVGLTYLFCIRPMRYGDCAMIRRPTEQRLSADHDDEIARLRAEIQFLKQAGSDGLIDDRSGT